MIFLEFEDLDFSFMLKKFNLIEKHFICICNSLSGKMFKSSDFIKVLGDDFSTFKIDSPVFDAIIPRQELKYMDELILTVFSNLAIPVKMKKQSYERFKMFVEVCDILNTNIFIRSVVGEFIQRKYHYEDHPFFLKKEHKSFKIDFINKVAFSTLFFQLGEWDFNGDFAEFYFPEYNHRELDEYQKMYFKRDSNFDYCCYLLLNSINNTEYSYDPWRYYKKDLLKVELNDAQKFAVNLFFLSQLYLLKKNILRIEDNDENYSIKEVTSDARTVVRESDGSSEQEKEKKSKTFVAKDNPKFRPEERRIFNHWNTKRLRKHKDGNSKGIHSFISLYREPSRFLEKGSLTVEEVILAIDQFEQMVNDPDVQPTNPKSKKFLRSFGLNDFVYHHRSGRSILSEILTKGIQIRVTPHSSEMFDKVSLVIQRGTKGIGLSTKNKNIVATYTNKVASYLDSVKSRLVPGNSYTFIAVEAIRDLFERKRFSFLFIISEEFFLNNFPNFCVNRGFIKKKSEAKIIQYRNIEDSKPSSNAVSKEKEESSSIQKMLELRKQNASKSGKFGKD